MTMPDMLTKAVDVVSWKKNLFCHQVPLPSDDVSSQGTGGDDDDDDVDSNIVISMTFQQHCFRTGHRVFRAGWYDVKRDGERGREVEPGRLGSLNQIDRRRLQKPRFRNSSPNILNRRLRLRRKIFPIPVRRRRSSC